MSNDPLALYTPKSIEEYAALDLFIEETRQRSDADWKELVRYYCRKDLYYLLTRVLSFGRVIHSEYGTPFHEHQLYIDMCRQVEYEIYDVGKGIDVSGRRSSKSTVRTHSGIIQLLLNYPEISIFIFSKTKQLATKHLQVIKTELETNEFLKYLFDDILWQSPLDAVKNQLTVWAIDNGIRVKRQSNRLTQTVECHAIYGGGPIGTGPDAIFVDDLEDSDMVSTPDKITTMNDAFSAAVSLLTPVVVKRVIIMITNTIFSENGFVKPQFDKYEKMNPGIVRRYPSEDLDQEGDGPLGGLVNYPATKSVLEQRYEEYPNKNEYVLQYCLNLNRVDDVKIREENLVYYDEEPKRMGRGKNVYITIDASRGVVDPTAINAIGLGSDKRFYWLDSHVEKLDPSKQEFYDAIMLMIAKWNNLSKRVVEIRVEQLGSSPWADIIRKHLEERGYYVPVIACRAVVKKTKDFTTGKAQRIFQRWSPMINAGLFVMPRAQKDEGHGLMMTNKDGHSSDIVEYFMETEFKSFPRARHDDIFDSIGLIHDEIANKERPLQFPLDDRIVRARKRMSQKASGHKTSWMSS